MNVSAWSVRNPVPVVLIFALLLVGGLGAFAGIGPCFGQVGQGLVHVLVHQVHFAVYQGL